MKRKAYCFDCKHEIEVELGSESCPLCGSDSWNFPPTGFKNFFRMEEEIKNEKKN